MDGKIKQFHQKDIDRIDRCNRDIRVQSHDQTHRTFGNSDRRSVRSLIDPGLDCFLRIFRPQTDLSAASWMHQEIVLAS